MTAPFKNFIKHFHKLFHLKKPHAIFIECFSTSVFHIRILPLLTVAYQDNEISIRTHLFYISVSREKREWPGWTMIYAERNGKLSNKSIRNIVHHRQHTAYVEVNPCEICQMENQFSIERNGKMNVTKLYREIH